MVGLGNPGSRYAGTRHNVGFEVLDHLATGEGLAFKRSWRLRSLSCILPVCDRDLLLVKPQGYMNRSGETAGRLRRRGLDAEEILVVVDDVDLPLGRVRLRQRGGAGGHNGLRSIIDALGGEGFPRLRIGVGGRAGGEALVGHVLSRFSPAERETMREVIPMAADAVLRAVECGVEMAMNQYNARDVGRDEGGSR